MSRVTFWDYLAIAGAFASILGLFLALNSTPVGILLIVVIGVATALVSSFLARQQPLPVVGREEMMETGTRLVRGAKSRVIMFGGDMSWAEDYADAITSVTDEGKDVEVVFRESNASEVVRNAEIVSNAGAKLRPVSIDCGIRGMLIDPEDPRDSLLYVATRSLKEGRPAVELGRPGKEKDYNYRAKIYRVKNDWLLIRTIKKLYKFITA